MKKLEIFLLILILCGAFTVRLYKIDNPIADWHSWRQADTAAVARNFIKDGYNFLRPQVDNFFPTSIERFPNTDRLFLTEPPIYQTIVYGLYTFFGVHEYLARLVSVVFSVGSVFLLYCIAKRFYSGSVALWSAFFFAFLPYSVYYGRVILPEPLMIFSSLAGILFLDIWFEKKKIWYFILSSLFFAVTFAVKPYQLTFLLPIFYLFLRHFRFNTFTKVYWWLFLLITIVPLLIWRYYTSLHPEGVPNWIWLLNDGNIRFKGAFFNWIFAERVAKLILGYWGVALFVIGFILQPQKKDGWFFHIWFVGVVIYMFIIAKGNVTHDYYQTPLIPILAVFMGRGVDYLSSMSKEINHWVSKALVVIIIAFMLAFSWYHIRGYYWVNHPEIVEAGKDADRILPKDAKVIAPYFGDVAFLYQTNRHGWSIIDQPLPELVTQGAQFLIALNPSEKEFELEKTYKVFYKKANYIIFDLRPQQ